MAPPDICAFVPAPNYRPVKNCPGCGRQATSKRRFTAENSFRKQSALLARGVGSMNSGPASVMLNGSQPATHAEEAVAKAEPPPRLPPRGRKAGGAGGGKAIAAAG